VRQPHPLRPEALLLIKPPRRVNDLLGPDTWRVEARRVRSLTKACNSASGSAHSNPPAASGTWPRRHVTEAMDAPRSEPAAPGPQFADRRVERRRQLPRVGVAVAEAEAADRVPALR
jgi:hypothetical protein